MALDLLDLYGRASSWTNEKISAAATQPDARTPCDDWDVRTLLDHMLETQRYFISSARGEEASPPSPEPPKLISKDPAGDFETARREVLQAFADPKVVEKTGPSLGIASSDMLLHGWDIAQATKQDAVMPDGLADAVYQLIHGRFTEEQRKGIFKPEVAVGPDATPQEKLLAYTGRQPT
jgi:uncharacterized protein (TIGR03086 family)